MVSYHTFSQSCFPTIPGFFFLPASFSARTYLLKIHRSLVLTSMSDQQPSQFLIGGLPSSGYIIAGHFPYPFPHRAVLSFFMYCIVLFFLHFIPELLI